MNGGTDKATSQPLVEQNHEATPSNKKISEGEVNHDLPIEDNGKTEVSKKCSVEDSNDPVIKEKTTNENKMKDEEGAICGDDDKEGIKGESEIKVDSATFNERADKETGGASVEVSPIFGHGEDTNEKDEDRGDSRNICSEGSCPESLPIKSDQRENDITGKKEEIMEEDVEMERETVNPELCDGKEKCENHLSLEVGDEHDVGEKEISMEVDDNTKQYGEKEVITEEQNTVDSVQENISEATNMEDDNEENELCIEICDVRTVEFEDDYVDSSDSTTVVDLNQCKDLSQGSLTTDSETTSPQKNNHNKKNSSQSESEIHKDTVSEVTSSKIEGQKTIKLSNDETSQHKTDGSRKNSISVDGNDILQNLYNQTSSLHDPELSTISTSGEMKVSPKKKPVTQSSSQGQNSLSDSSDKQNSPQRQSSVSESSSENSPVADSSQKTSGLNISPASSLLSNLANSVMKIKSEPVDTGYDTAMTEQESSSSTERLRLPIPVTEASVAYSNLSLVEERTSMDAAAFNPQSLFPSVVGHANIANITSNTNTYSKQNSKNGQRPLAPKPKAPLAFLLACPPPSTPPKIVTSSATLGKPITKPMSIQVFNAATGTSEVSKPTAIQFVKTSVATSPSTMQVLETSAAKSKTSQPVSLKVLKTFPATSTASQPASIQIVKTSAATSTTSQPASIQVVQTYTPTSKETQPTSMIQVVKTYPATSNGGQNAPEVKSTDEDCFENDLIQMCNKHQVKSVELTKITDFLQRKNGLKSYKHSKPQFRTKTYPCLECGDSFNLKSSLDFHMNRCSMRIQYNCSECNNTETFHNKCQLLFHMRQHASATPSGQSKVPPPLRISSEQISILSPSKEDLESVYKDPDGVQDPVQMSCLICNQRFQDEEQLRTHLGAYDLVCSFAYQCQHCPEVLPRVCAYKAHMNFHTHVGPYVCPECGKFFVQFGQFSKHLQKECCHLNRIYMLTCGVCGVKVSDGLVKLKQHIVTHINTYIKCQYCNLAFDKKQSHSDHIRKFHPGKQENRTDMSFVYTCMFCKTLLQKAELIDRHMDIHVPEMKKNAQFAFKCFQCTSGAKAFIFPTQVDLLHHNKECHQQKFLCKFCQKLFTTKSSLDSHVSSIHANKTSVETSGKITLDPKKLVVSVCKVCRVLVPLEDLPKHKCIVKSQFPQPQAKTKYTKEIQPKNVKPMPIMDPLPPSDKLRFICMYCKDLFTVKEDVFEHQKYACKNLSPKPIYPTTMVFCNVCGVPFPNLSWLHIHLRDHCKEGYILCRYCKDLAFKNKSELMEHQKNLCHICVDKTNNTAIQSRKKKSVKDNYKLTTCKVCENAFYSFDLKLKHVAKHRVEGKLICSFCDKNDFTSSEETDKHILKCCQKRNPLEHGYCCTCHKTFPNPDQLVVHLQDHVEERKLLCCKCQKDGFTNKADLVNHSLQCGKKLRDSIPGQACTLCREIFPTMNIKQLYRHLTNHVVRGVHICCKCQVMGWRDHSEMKSHQIACGLFDMMEGKKKMQDLVCFICHKCFQEQSHLQEHIQMHRNIGSLICVNCYRMKWKDEEELAQHEKECKVSEKRLASGKQSQKAAEPQKKGYITMDHFCEHCGQKYSHKSQLQEHISQEHTSFPCHLCGLAYDSKSALESHVRMVHDGKKTFFACDICKSKKISKMFASQIGLQKHMQKAHKHSRRPSGGLDSKEEDGEDSSSSMASLTGQKPPSPPPVKRLRVEGESVFTCAKCSFVSEDTAKFSEHIKGHNINRSSQCPDCGLCFTIIPALKKHLFMVHKIRDADKHLKEKGLNTVEKEFDSDSEDISPVIKKAKLMNGKESESEEEDAPTNPLECSVCHTEFENERSVRMHMRIHGMAFIKSARKPKRRSLSRKSETSPNKSDVSEVETDKSVSKQAGEESFQITTLKEETIESDVTEHDIPEECSVTGESHEQEVYLGRVKQEVMDET